MNILTVLKRPLLTLDAQILEFMRTYSNVFILYLFYTFYLPARFVFNQFELINAVQNTKIRSRYAYLDGNLR